MHASDRRAHPPRQLGKLSILAMFSQQRHQSPSRSAPSDSIAVCSSSLSMQLCFCRSSLVSSLLRFPHGSHGCSGILAGTHERFERFARGRDVLLGFGKRLLTLLDLRSQPGITLFLQANAMWSRSPHATPRRVAAELLPQAPQRLQGGQRTTCASAWPSLGATHVPAHDAS